MSRFDAIGILIGFAAVEYGIAQWSPPAAWIAGGVLVMVAALWPTTRKAGR